MVAQPQADKPSSAQQGVDVASGRRLTPMLKQYIEAKEQAPDAILLFRMGDFYELFFDDAKVAAQALDLTLTARDKGPDAIPMAGVPHHAVSGYIARLLELGFSVAICDQVEDPKKAKGLVKREITRLITPGTIADLDALDPASASYLAFVAPDAAREHHGFVLALLDLLAGEIICTHLEGGQLVDELRRMNAREVVAQAEHLDVVSAHLRGELPLRCAVAMPKSDEQARCLWRDRFGCESIEGMWEGGGPTERMVVAGLVAFAENSQRRRLLHLMVPRAYRGSDFVVLDEATRRNLELLRTQMEARQKGSLRWHLDRCATSMGSRRLEQWLLFPLRDRQAINRRLDVVEGLVAARSVREQLHKELSGVRDIERLMGRVAVLRATPKDLVALRESLRHVAQIKAYLSAHDSPLSQRWRQVDEAADLFALLETALQDDAPTLATEGAIFKRGYRDDLDELIELSTQGHDFLHDLERRERERTGIGSLKVRYNKVFGYYIEVTRANLAQVPSDYLRKQTLVGAERFITPELKDYEEKVVTADERRKEREAELFAELVEELTVHTVRLRAMARLIAESDALASLARVADEHRYVRPQISDRLVLRLVQSRHPVLERLMPGGERFIPNDVFLDTANRQMMLVTGPNMAGKSTAMRQAALCALMAYMGGFVPAKEAEIGLCDRLFTRVGASDNLAAGQSTFMVEMTETATILREATAQSLVLLDEIGRGTSTFDGVSIAWAVAEYLHDTLGCRAMFATHYHELTALAATRPRIVNASVAVRERDGEVVFLRQLIDEPANRSYGIAVARLAGLPAEVLDRAASILTQLESSDGAAPGNTPHVAHPEKNDVKQSAQLTLFTPVEKKIPPHLVELERDLVALDPLNMTPMQALEVLHRLHNRVATPRRNA